MKGLSARSAFHRRLVVKGESPFDWVPVWEPGIVVGNPNPNFPTLPRIVEKSGICECCGENFLFSSALIKRPNPRYCVNHAWLETVRSLGMLTTSWGGVRGYNDPYRLTLYTFGPHSPWWETQRRKEFISLLCARGYYTSQIIGEAECYVQPAVALEGISIHLDRECTRYLLSPMKRLDRIYGEIFL